MPCPECGFNEWIQEGTGKNPWVWVCDNCGFVSDSDDPSNDFPDEEDQECGD